MRLSAGLLVPAVQSLQLCLLCSHAVCRMHAAFLLLIPRCALPAAVTPSELALAWCKSRWFVTSTIIGGECSGSVLSFWTWVVCACFELPRTANAAVQPPP